MFAYSSECSKGGWRSGKGTDGFQSKPCVGTWSGAAWLEPLPADSSLGCLGKLFGGSPSLGVSGLSKGVLTSGLFALCLGITRAKGEVTTSDNSAVK